MDDALGILSKRLPNGFHRRKINSLIGNFIPSCDVIIVSKHLWCHSQCLIQYMTCNKFFTGSWRVS